MISTRYRVIAGIAALLVIFACKDPVPTKKDPPQEGKPFPGNVSITFWVGASHPVDVIYSIGGVTKPTHSCEESCHWDDTAKPEQKIVIAVGHRNKSQEDLLDVEVVQGNNGRTVCKDSNADRDPIDPVGCEGKVVI